MNEEKSNIDVDEYQRIDEVDDDKIDESNDNHIIEESKEESITMENDNIESKKNKIGNKIKNGIISFCEVTGEIIDKVWINTWNKIQIKLFWVVILIVFGASIGYGVSNWYFQKRIEECIQLGGFIYKTEKYDPALKKDVTVTEIYDINLRVR